MTKIPFDFVGTRAYVYLKLFGTADGSENPVAGSIVDKTPTARRCRALTTASCRRLRFQRARC